MMTMFKILKCQDCDYEQELPYHCKQAMHVEVVEGTEKLVCWMGPECGVQDLPVHHDKPMYVVDSRTQKKK